MSAKAGHPHRNLVLLGVGLVVDELLLPRLVALVDDLDGVLFALGLAGEGKDVLWLAVWDLVNPEPFVGGLKKSIWIKDRCNT
jgi:hypothetical protein